MTNRAIVSKNQQPVKHHVKASIEDINWVRSQLPCVQQLWLDCVAAEQFGNQQREITTNLSNKSFRAAKTALEDRGLFAFEPICKLTSSGRSTIVGWKVENLHGYYIKAYWEILPEEESSRENLPEEMEALPVEEEVLPAQRENLPKEKPESIATQESDLTQQCSTTPQQPTKVVEEYVDLTATTQPLLGAVAVASSKENADVDPPLPMRDRAEIVREDIKTSGEDNPCAGLEKCRAAIAAIKARDRQERMQRMIQRNRL